MAKMLLINPKRRTRRKRKASARRRTHRVSVVSANPRRKRRHRRRSTVAHFRANPKRRSFRRSRRKSGGLGGLMRGGGGLVKGTILPAATGAAGALAVDVLFGLLPLPANLTTGMLRPVVRLAGAYAVGKGVGMVTNKRTGDLMMAGAVTVIAYDILKSVVRNFAPNLTLSEYVGYNQLGYIGAGQSVGTMDSGRVAMPVGEYV